MEKFDYDIRQISADEKGNYNILPALKSWGQQGWELVDCSWRSETKIKYPQADDQITTPIEITVKIFEAILKRKIS